MAGRHKKETTTVKQKPNQEYSCMACGDMHKHTEYYASYNPVHKTGKILYCKSCLKKMISDENGNVDLDKIKSTLQLMDKPFLYNIYKASLEEKGDAFGNYIKNIQMPQYRYLGWSDSKFLPEVEQELNYNNSNSTTNNKINHDSFSNFIVTDEIYEKWNYGYKPEEYYYFEKKYNQLKNNYPEKTAMHTEALLNYIRYRVKEELATAKGDVKDAKDWGSLAKEAATAAKINPSQLSAADLADGLSGFGQLARAVEQAVDIVEILPKFKQKPQDNVDFTLWCYINYVRGLKGLGDCEYKDIYGFYEQKKKDMENKILNNVEDDIVDESEEELEVGEE